MVIPSPKVLCRLTVAGGAIFALACGHTDPFSTPPYGTTQPFDPTPPVQLTLNEGADRGASWLPDGTGIVYSAQQLGRLDADVCLAELPAGGGTQRRLVCDAAGLGSDTSNAIESPAVAAGGMLAFVKASNSIGAPGPNREALAIAPAVDPPVATDVQRIPYTIPGEPEHTAVAHLRWLGSSRLVYVGGLASRRRACQICRLDTIVTGLKVAMLDLSAAGASPVALSGTDFASGVAPGASSDEIYFTLNGDTRIYHHQLSSGDVSVAYDFGAAGVARDVHVAGGRLTAIVGGRVAFSVDPILGPVQWDSGGIVHLVELSSGADVALASGARLFRRPALAPAGDRVVAEGYALIITSSTGTAPDTTVSPASDLFLFTSP